MDGTASPESVRADQQGLVGLVGAIFGHAGVPPDSAGYLARSLVQADARGMHSHGVLRVAQYLPRILAGGIRAVTEGAVLRDGGAITLIDGQGGIGQILSRHGMERAIAKAREHGVGLVVIRDSNHHGESGSFALMAAEAGMIGLVTSNGSPSAPAWGAREPRVTGPWPLAIAAPAPGEPILLDTSLGVVAKGRIQHFADSGRTLPPGWGFDREGAPTTDPQAVLDGGWGAFIGDYKGWGLLLMIEVLTGLLAGGRVGDEIGDLFGGDAAQSQGLSHFLLAIDVKAVQPLDSFLARIGALRTLLKGSTLAPGFAEVLLPGEREFRQARQAAAEGIPLPMHTVRRLIEAGQETGCPPPMIHAAFPGLEATR